MIYLLMSMATSLPTRGQLERELSQQIQALYRNNLGHRLGEVDCQIFDGKIAIVLENAITPAEQLLVSDGKQELVEEIHSSLTEALYSRLKALIEQIVGVSVLDLLSDTTLETERTGMIAVLAAQPQLRNRTNGGLEPS